MGEFGNLEDLQEAEKIISNAAIKYLRETTDAIEQIYGYTPPQTIILIALVSPIIKFIPPGAENEDAEGFLGEVKDALDSFVKSRNRALSDKDIASLNRTFPKEEDAILELINFIKKNAK